MLGHDDSGKFVIFMVFYIHFFFIFTSEMGQGILGSIQSSVCGKFSQALIKVELTLGDLGCSETCGSGTPEIQNCIGNHIRTLNKNAFTTLNMHSYV